jgi:drug/metabolite transporter (DMT)-like permease
MFAASFFFASMGATIHWLGESVHWSVVSFCRMFFSAVLLITLARMRGIPVLVVGPRAMWVRAGAGSLGMIGNFYALTHLPISDATAIYHTMPVWVALIRRVTYGERLSYLQWVCVCAAVAGVFITEEASPDKFNLGIAAALGGAFFFAIATIGMSFLGHHHPQTITIHFALFASAVSAGIIFVSLPGGATFVPPTPAIGFGLLIPAVLGSMAQVLMAGALGKGHNVTVVIVGLFQVVFAGVYDVVFWDRSFSLLKIVGIAIIVSCVAGMALARRRDS